MTFAEFLHARGEERFFGIVTSRPSKQPEAVHEALLEELRRYFFVGGMPECVAAYCESGSLRDAFDVQAELLSAYRQDFSKYTPHTDTRCLTAVLSSVARQAGR